MLDSSTQRFFFREHGLRFEIEFSNLAPDLLFDKIVPACWLPIAELRGVDLQFSLAFGDNHGVWGYRLFVGGELVMGTSQLEQFVAPAAKRIHWEVAQASRSEFFLHAGVVGVEGKAVLLPGRTFSGKSTMVRELLRLGMTYYSDEYALVTDSTVPMIRAFPRQLSLRPDMSGVDEPEGNFLGAAPPEIAVDSIYFLQFLPEVEWRTDALSAGQATLKLFENSLVAQTRPAELMQALGRLCGLASCFEGIRGEGSLAARLLVSEVLGRR